MNNYWFNRQEILQKAKEIYSKEKRVLCTKQGSYKRKVKEFNKNLSQEKKDKIKEYQEKCIKNWFIIKKKHYKINDFFLIYKFFLLNIRMLEKTLRHLIEKNFTNPSNQSI